MKAKTARTLMTPAIVLAAGAAWNMLLAISAVEMQAQTPTAGQARAAQTTAARAGATTAMPAPARPAQSATPASPEQGGAPAATPASPSTAAGAPPSGARRDPFRPLISLKKPADTLPARLPAGKPGLVIGQLTIQGIVRNLDGKWMAVVDNKTKRSYFLYERDELYNGVVTSVTADSVTFEERSLDAAGRTRTREVVKRLGGI